MDQNQCCLRKGMKDQEVGAKKCCGVVDISKQHEGEEKMYNIL